MAKQVAEEKTSLHCNSEGFLSKRKVTSSFQRMIQRRNIVDVLIKCPTPECACCFSEVLIQLSDGTEIKEHSNCTAESEFTVRLRKLDVMHLIFICSKAIYPA